jgi:aspartyl-tRNA(Asn)/glutamyl-tRNA(Gln) amidotransferase subunit A
MSDIITTDAITLTQLSAALHDGTVTSRQTTERLLERADRLDSALGTYLARFDDTALVAASRLDAELAAGRDRGALHGVPVAVKDIIRTDEGPTTAQSLILDPHWGDAGDAPVVARLRAAGAVIVGKTTTMEFACGCPDPDKPFPIPRNPWDLSTWPGGSSSGTGSGVAAGLFFGGLGTDTGGSIRCPASFCGITGHKPTFGLVPKSGCTPLGYSYDHIGPMARSALDCALMLQVMAGYDLSDPTTSTAPVPDFVRGLNGDLNGMRIGVDRGLLERYPTDPAIPDALEAALVELGRAGAEVIDIEIPHYEALVAATMNGWTGEALANHISDLRTRWTDYGRPTRIVIATGAFVSSADYVQAQRVRRVGANAIAELMRNTCDVIVTPTAARGAPKVDGLSFTDIVGAMFTPIWNATGFPAMSVPMGRTAQNLPLGLQIAGLPFTDATILKVGDAFQRLTTHHLQQPEISGAELV